MVRDLLMLPLEGAGLDMAFLTKARGLGIRFAWQLLLYLPEGAPVGGVPEHRLGPWPRQCHEALLRLGVDLHERPSRDELRGLYARSFPTKGQERDSSHEWRHPIPLALPLEDLDLLAVRPCAVLANIGITHVWQLVQHDVDDLVRLGFGPKAAVYLRGVLADAGLPLGLDLPAPLLAELQEIAPPLSPPAG